METMSEGAEATVYRDGDRVVKERDRKDYRHPALDERLREERTGQEARLLEKARQAGVRVPEVEQTGDATLSLTALDGAVLRDVFAERDELWPVIGDYVARLHGRDIIHGDLTTSNMLVVDDTLFFIDFGLGSFSQRVEDRATDLHLLKEVLDSTHAAVADEAMDAILAAYREHADDAEDVLERYAEIEERGRYK